MRRRGSDRRGERGEARLRGRRRDRRWRARRRRASSGSSGPGGRAGCPATYSVMDYAIPDDGGGPATEHGDGEHARRDLRRPTSTGRPGTPQRRFTLTAEHGEVRLASGRTVDALTFNGTVPGPELRVRQGDLVEVTLRNKDVKDGVTIHWHGVDLPNAEDGVAGVTQNAVPPGGELHLPLPRRAGRDVLVPRPPGIGLRGAPRPLRRARDRACDRRRACEWTRADIAVAVHTLNGTPLVNSTDGVEKRAVDSRHAGAAPGHQHRQHAAALRHRRHAVRGRRDRRHRPRRPDAAHAAGRSSSPPAVATTSRSRCPPSPVKLAVEGTLAGLALSPDGTADPPPPPSRAGVRPGRVRPARTDAVRRLEPLRPHVRARRRPQAGVLRRQAGNAVVDQRRHLPARADVHGRGGRPRPDHDRQRRRAPCTRCTSTATTCSCSAVTASPSRGSPWWSDTLNVEPGEKYEVAFRADNPGIWMDHCHNLSHAAAGLTMHLAYMGVTTPFETGGTAHNHPE